MNFSSRPLIESDILVASQLDRKWFGEYGISEKQLRYYINQHPTESMALLANNIFCGFATFEILFGGRLPSDYVGKVPKFTKVLFIQQFTTTTNYSKTDMSMDTELLKSVEQKANESGCLEVWEALASNHPYSEKSNVEYDAFGFYEKNGYMYDRSNLIEWKPDSTIAIPCYLFSKKLKQQVLPNI